MGDRDRDVICSVGEGGFDYGDGAVIGAAQMRDKQPHADAGAARDHPDLVSLGPGRHIAGEAVLETLAQQ